MKPVLYYDERSPPVRSCLILIQMLNIDVELRKIDLFKGDQYSKEYREINPAHTVPTLVHEDLTLTDSHVIMMYLCDKYQSEGGPALWPQDYAERIAVLNMLFFECSVLFRRDSEMIGEIVRKGYRNADNEYHERKVLEVYGMLEQFLSRHKFIATENLTIADLSIVTTLSTADLMFPIESAKWPLLYAWFRHMQSLPACSINAAGLQSLRVAVEQKGKFEFPSAAPLPPKSEPNSNE